MLTDIDKGNIDRSDPQPNRHDRILPASIMSRGTNSVNYTTQATDLAAISSAKNGQFTIVQVGNFTTTQTYTTTAPGAGLFTTNDFILYSAPHNLGFTPGVFAYEQSSSGQFSPMPLTKYQTGTTSQALWYSFFINVDGTNVNIELLTITYGDASFTFQPGFIFKWYLLQQVSNI